MVDATEAAPARELGTSAIKVDGIGIGQGVVDSLEEEGFDRVGVNVSERARDVERFADLRAELWWGLRERLDPEKGDGVALPRDDGLLSELASVRYKITGRGQVRVEPKDEMRKRLGRSPDLADAVVLAFAPRGGGGFVWAGGETLASQMFEDRGSRSWR